MFVQHARNVVIGIAALALSGIIAQSQQPPAPATPSATQPAAPVERQPPQGQGGPRFHPGSRPGGMRPGMTQGQRSSNFRGADMHGHGNFRGGFHGPQRGQMDGGFHIGPAGMWWKDPMVVQRLTLTADQTRKMDDIFQQSRLQLIDLKASVEKQQVMLEPMLSANPLDVAKASAQIDKVAQARADLEKANAKMLLNIRGALTADQWTKLRDHRFGAPDGQAAPGAPAGGQAPGGGPRHGMRGGGPPPSANNLINPIDQP
jgi:Spy/CpxP family protein refolding chaperone